jgi:hypothetical protein
MSRQEGLSQWTATVSTQLPHLSRPQAAVLAAWSYGIVLAQCCGLTTVAAFLAALLGERDNTVRQRLREWYRDAADKRGAQRQELDVCGCFAPLLRWVLAWWASDERRLVLALDATTLGDRFVVLVISVVYRGCGIPIAWQVLPAQERGAWRPHWEQLLASLSDSVPADWQVLVLADRGLYARWLFTAIQQQGWHPFLRINRGGLVRPAGTDTFVPLRTLVPSVGGAWCGEVTCFASRDSQLSCTLLARWDAGHREPWLVLTDLAPAAAEVAWYGLRGWIEQGFKDCKRGGWQWQHTRMSDPRRVARLWLALAVATLWAVSVGGEADATLPASSWETLPAAHVARRRGRHRPPPRLLSCFRRGVLRILAALLRGEALPLGRFLPEPWPAMSRNVTTLVPPAAAWRAAA